jgi:hypothetical protein
MDNLSKLPLTQKTHFMYDMNNLDNNYLTDNSLAHIQKQNFKLLELNVGFNQFTHQGIQELTYLTQPLQKLYLKNLKL